MVFMSKPAPEQFSFIRNSKPTPFFSGIPLIDLSKPDSMHQLVKACEEFGFFKVINHGVPMEFISKLESEAVDFFSLPLSEKEKRFSSVFGDNPEKFRCALNDYVSAVKRMACEILEMMADGLKLQQRNVFSKLFDG
ncbi:hypothetical protein OIU77_015925 [Salix suchowensis]|uniref:Non-haem dioxygenase N-terminal domain-containing protein n=1 Tax=Salix suchowensis TaxID=1278906 RepID=A0ABQ8ZIN5_9ROSI|nr:hypothetical protein OIU77_015925 [Salix suchowensis]